MGGEHLVRKIYLSCLSCLVGFMGLRYYFGLTSLNGPFFKGYGLVCLIIAVLLLSCYFKDLPQNILLLGKIESSREYSFIKIDKIELADREVLKNPIPAFLEMTEIVTEDPCINTVIYPQKDILTFYTILERYDSRILLI